MSYEDQPSSACSDGHEELSQCADRRGDTLARPARLLLAFWANKYTLNIIPRYKTITLY